MALANLIVQIVLAGVLTVAYGVVRRRKFRRHCYIMRGAVAAQVASIVVSMSSPFVGFVRNPPRLSFLLPETVIHHTLGIVVVLIFIFVNLSYEGVIPGSRHLKPLMRTAAVLWIITLGLGIHLYFRLYR